MATNRTDSAAIELNAGSTAEMFAPTDKEQTSLIGKQSAKDMTTISARSTGTEKNHLLPDPAGLLLFSSNLFGAGQTIRSSGGRIRAKALKEFVSGYTRYSRRAAQKPDNDVGDNTRLEQHENPENDDDGSADQYSDRLARMFHAQLQAPAASGQDRNSDKRACHLPPLSHPHSQTQPPDPNM